MKLILKVSNSYESLYNVSWNYKKLGCPFNQSKVFLPKFCMMLPRVFMFACEKVKHVLTSRPKFDRVPLYTG